jgi:murein DD-endopeptidase MepM/ murein hydrolase activator NlpD
MLQETAVSSPLREETHGSDSSEHGELTSTIEGSSTQDAASQPSLSGGGSASTQTKDRGRVVGLGAMGALVAVGIGLIVASPRKTVDAPPALARMNADVRSQGPKPSSENLEAANLQAAAIAISANIPSAPAPSPRPPPVWRVSSLKVDGNVEVAEGTFGKNGLVTALTQAGVPRPEIKRIAHAFEGIRRIDRPSPTDAFVVARDKSKNTIVAFEYATSPLDVWQARADDASPDSRIVAKKLDLWVEHKRVASGLVVSADLAKAITSSGLRPEIVEAVDDALEGHIEAGSIRAGARMRIAATEDWVDGTFARVKVDAIEFVPTQTQGGDRKTSPLRIYFYERDRENGGSARRAPAPGFYDAKGKQPYRGAFRSPLALARVTSRFNPKRMHPVLHTVMPHQGVDFGATTGTPVYASAAGTVQVAGNGGPCGNMVEIEHGGGVATVYCHLKGFAQGLRAGQKVEPRQLVGYVGQTGRVTGPHLHFGVKKNGTFIDPLALKMDGVRVLPPIDRDAFNRRRADLDAVIDGVALPSAADVPEENEDKDLHGD